MGIFKDFATSSLGDVTIGAFQGLEDAAQRDVIRNSEAASNSLRKENEAFALTELAYKNRGEISNVLARNPDAFGLSVQEGLSINQVADRFANYMFRENRSMFEHKDMNKVKADVAKFMLENPGEGFTIYDPYISGEDRFKREQELHQARVSEITKMPKADKLLMKLQKAEEGVATPESVTDELTKVAALTAKGYGILNTYPTSQAGMKNLQFVMTNIITHNAKEAFPNDAAARAQFINQKLYDNNIDPTDGIMYTNNMNYKIMSDVISAQGGAIASKMAELTNGIAAAKNDEERQLLNNQLNQLVLEQHKTMDTYSKSAGSLMAGMDRSQVFPATDAGGVPLPQVMEGYIPSINNKGEVIIELANGNTQQIPLEVLIDSPESVKLLPQVTQNYINQIKENLFVNGEMIEPKRDMFEPGNAGDKAFKDFLGIYNIFFPDTSDSFIEDVEKLEPTPRKETTDADITKLKKKDSKTDDEIKIEELPSADTKAPPRKPDQPEEPKEKSLQEKIQEDFGNANVGTSGGDTTVKEDVKSDTQRQTEDVFEGSGVEPMFQSASLASNDKFVKRIMEDEGEPFLEATKAFEDEKNFTIGYGRNNASIKKGDKITLEQAQKNLAEDVEIRLEEIQDLIPNFSKFSSELQLALFSEYFRGSVRQSPKAVKLINEGKFREAAAEFLDNDEYRDAVDRGRRGIRKRMKRVYNLLRREGAQSMLSNTVSA